MEHGKGSSDVEATNSGVFSRNQKVTYFLELCIQPKNVEEMENILKNFWKEIDCPLESAGFCDFTLACHACMFALEHIYENYSASLSAVSRSLYAYQNQIQQILKANETKCSFMLNDECFLNELRTFDNVHTFSKCEEMLVDVGLGSILNPNVGLLAFLVKFRLLEFPLEPNEKGRKIAEILVKRFKEFSIGRHRNTSILLNELLNPVRYSDIGFRRSLLIMCTIVIVGEYGFHEWVESRHDDFLDLGMKDMCMRKLMCLKMFISTTTETKVMFSEIEKFIATFLNPHFNAEICRFLVEISRKLFCEVSELYNPRSLKDLARCKVRASLREHVTLPWQVNQLEIPDTLKKYLLFHSEGIWELLTEDHLRLESAYTNYSIFARIRRVLVPLEDDY